ncbi:MAG: cobalt-zinc-cadmium efflux system membrane fusion protein, partial [Saprospiraceae bacterium]
MKYIYFSAILLAGLLVLMSSCKHEHGEGTHTHGDETHAPHGPELEPFAFTIWTEKSEIFVEFPPLIVGKESRFAAHFSEMVNFKALQAGEVTVRLRKGTQSVKENSVSAPSSPGIFRPAITPDKEGVFDLVFFLKTGSFSDTITISSLTVYPNAAAAMAANPPQPEGDEISFLKEQAWKIDFAIQQVKRQPIREVIHTSGEIQPVKGDEKIIAAKSSGIVFFKSKSLQEGRDVRSGESLFSISSKGLLQSNMEEKYQVAKARVENTKADFERAENLVNEKIIGQKEYER